MNHVVTYNQVLRRMDVLLSMPEDQASRREKVAVLYRDKGMTQKGIAQVLGIDQTTVSTDLRALDVPKKTNRGRPRRTGSDSENISDFYGEPSVYKSHLVELDKADESQREAIWNEAMDRTGGKPTTKAIREIRSEYQSPPVLQYSGKKRHQTYDRYLDFIVKVNALPSLLQMIGEPDDEMITPEVVEQWSKDLTTVIRTLTQLRRRLKKIEVGDDVVRD